jgi:hypothetical protein
MSKKIKRYIYENGHLFKKYTENESNQAELNKNINDEYSRNNFDNYNIEFPKLEIKNNNNNNYKIFSTQIDEDILNENNKEESEKKNKSISEEKIKVEKLKKDKENNFKSIETNPSLRRNPKLLRKLNQTKLSSQIQKICKYLYTSPRKSNKDNIKFKIAEKENEFIKSLKKNYLVDEDLINNQLYRNKIIKNKINQSNQNFFNSNRNINNNIISDNDFIKKYYNEENTNTIDIEKLTSYKFENYSRNKPKYKHPQLYKLKLKEEDNDVKLPPIKTGNQTPIELTQFIPIKKGIKKEEQRNEYMNYKIMRYNRLEGFHI